MTHGTTNNETDGTAPKSAEPRDVAQDGTAPDGTALRDVAQDGTAPDGTAKLFNAMPSHRKTLLAILRFCRCPHKVPEVLALVEEERLKSFTHYSAADYCVLLEQAGSLCKVTEDGKDYTQAKAEPAVVEEDGMEYLVANEPPEAFWVTTDAGAAYLEADKPLERLRGLVASESRYQRIYEEVLLLCLDEKGRSIAEIDAALDNDQLLQEPRIYARHFVDLLEKCDALDWVDSWKTSSLGRQWLEEARASETEGGAK
ncbi:MAG: hypothetical protein LBG81_01925 [Coriobacteriaceae bacterium]|nr:hypothetical protein [Coriobacteriaceae bacterium]